MEVVLKKLINYETSTGKCPVRAWLDELDSVVSARIQARIRRITYGNFGDAKSVGQGVSELRITFGSGYRVYFARYGEEIILLLCGGDKASQVQDIQTAQNYWLDFKRRINV